MDDAAGVAVGSASKHRSGGRGLQSEGGNTEETAEAAAAADLSTVFPVLLHVIEKPQL